MPSARYKINDPLNRIIINFIDVQAIDMPYFNLKTRLLSKLSSELKIVE
jgi:hypothetical protein